MLQLRHFTITLNSFLRLYYGAIRTAHAEEHQYGTTLHSERFSPPPPPKKKTLEHFGNNNVSGWEGLGRKSRKCSKFVVRNVLFFYVSIFHLLYHRCHSVLFFFFLFACLHLEPWKWPRQWGVRQKLETDGIMFQEYCFRRKHSLSSAANSASSAIKKDSGSASWHTMSQIIAWKELTGTRWGKRTHWAQCLKPRHCCQRSYLLNSKVTCRKSFGKRCFRKRKQIWRESYCSESGDSYLANWNGNSQTNKSNKHFSETVTLTFSKIIPRFVFFGNPLDNNRTLQNRTIGNGIISQTIQKAPNSVTVKVYIFHQD